MRYFDFSRYVCWGDNEMPSRDAAYKQLIGHRFTFIKKTLHALFAHMGCEGKSTPEGLALLDEIFSGNPPHADKASAAELAQASTSVVSWFYSARYSAFCAYYADTVPVNLD